jgi:hypothetical protein
MSRITFCLSCQGGPPSMFFNIDGEHSWIFISTHQGARHRCFFNIDNMRSRISSSGTSQGAHHHHFLR